MWPMQCGDNFSLSKLQNKKRKKKRKKIPEQIGDNKDGRVEFDCPCGRSTESVFPAFETECFASYFQKW